MKIPVKFRIDLEDPRMPGTGISLEAEVVPGMGSIAIGESGKPWAGRWSLSEEGLRALAIAAKALADQVRSDRQDCICGSNIGSASVCRACGRPRDVALDFSPSSKD